MQITSVVIHEIIKQEQVQEATMVLTDTSLDINHPYVKKTIKELDESFKNKTPNRAKFSEDGFQSVITDFSNFDTIEVSKQLTETLKIGIQNILLAKGGYLVFTEFTVQDDFLAIFLIRNTDGTQLTLTGNSWDVDSTEYLNVDHFAMGVKINITKLLDATTNERYIKLVRGSTDISKYFENWIGLEDTKQESRDASALFEIANHIDLPEGVNRDELKKKIYQYAKNSQDNLVNLKGLSSFLYQDENILSNYAEETGKDIDGEFRLRGTYLNKFIKVRANADGITLVAPLEKFSPNKIQLGDDNQTIIIHSPSLVEEIKESLALNN